jgi:hypothetical protein
MAAMLQGAKEVLPELDHQQPKRAMGAIILAEQCLAKAADMIDCPGPIVDNNAQLSCPLREAAYGVRAFAAGRWDQVNYHVELEKVTGGAAESRPTGHYM